MGLRIARKINCMVFHNNNNNNIQDFCSLHFHIQCVSAKHLFTSTPVRNTDSFHADSLRLVTISVAYVSVKLFIYVYKEICMHVTGVPRHFRAQIIHMHDILTFHSQVLRAVRTIQSLFGKMALDLINEF